MSIEFVNEKECKDAVQDVRADSTPTDWCLLTYESPKSQKIVLAGKGSGGISELSQQLNDDIVGYGLVRKTDRIDDSTTVKFVFINWLGENVPRMQKARISVHLGKMKEFIGQSHVDITAAHQNELSEDILMQKIMDTSGSGSRVVDKNTGAKVGNTTQSGSFIGTRTSGGVNKAKQGLDWADQAALKQAVQAVRNDADPNTWVLFTYDGEDSNTITLLGTGKGTVNEELVPLLKDNVVAYGIVRKVEKIDESETVKFAFIRFVGDNIHRMLRARLGTHFGAITEFLHPYHVSIDATAAKEISDEIIVTTIKNAAGTSVHVLENRSPSVPTQVRRGTASSSGGYKPPAVPKSVPTSDTNSVKLADETATKADIKEVRTDTSGTNWVLIGYEGGKGNVIVTLGKGSGGVEELKELLQDNIVAYGLVRKTEKIDESVTVKFVHICWIGDNIDRMHRARIGTHKGAVTALLSPYHIDLNCTQLSELSETIIEQKIGENSGTKSKVKN